MVSVICICHNHAPYVLESIQSVLSQTYAPIELIVVDDASTDESCAVIQEYLSSIEQDIPFIRFVENVGNCKAFNQAFSQSNGDYIIDLAADDVLLPNRIEEQVLAFEKLSEDYGVVFSDANLIDDAGNILRNYYQRGEDGIPASRIPSGNVYQELLKKAFICTPTMMMKRTMLEELGGYDETLSYEDYDLWVRSGRKWKYYYQDLVLTQKRILSTSLGKQFYQPRRNPHLASTLKVCKKAFLQNQIPAENKALSYSIQYHFRQSVWMNCPELAKEFAKLLVKIQPLSFLEKALLSLVQINFPFFPCYQLYQRIRSFI